MDMMDAMKAKFKYERMFYEEANKEKDEGHPCLLHKRSQPLSAADESVFVADVKGRRSRDIVETALGALCRLDHRGASGAEVSGVEDASVSSPQALRAIGVATVRRASTSCREKRRRFIGPPPAGSRPSRRRAGTGRSGPGP